MRLGLAFDLQTDPTDVRQAEFDPPGTIYALVGALKALGHTVVALGNAQDILRHPHRLDEIDLVFNIAEGSDGRCREAWVPSLLDGYGIPYVGSAPLALSLGLDKVASKRLAVASGIPTPSWIAFNHPDSMPAVIGLSFPVIVKPRYEGSGIGIDVGAIVCDRDALARRCHWLYENLREPLLVEEFVAFGELTVCVIGNEPPRAYPAIQRPLDCATRLSYHLLRSENAKWEAPLELNERLDAEARQIALAMFKALGCRDMARVDLRVDRQGKLFFLEINPLPSFDPEGSFGLLAEHLGITYTELLGRILEAAWLRIAGCRVVCERSCNAVA